MVSKMSKDFSTYISFSGKTEHILKALETLKEYNESKDGVQVIFPQYIFQVFHEGYNKIDVDDTEKMKEYIESKNGNLDVQLFGPFGKFDRLDEVKLFWDMAKHSPHVHFNGEITGENETGKQELKAEYDGTQLCTEYNLVYYTEG